ncbi:MAG: hypothetical protein SF052_04755 [Bacteroidia bacterium]|nr:hypothetical protein [Bacteroidia bacterium]
MKKNWIIFSLIYLLLNPFTRADDRIVYDNIKWNTYELPFYTFAEYTPQVALRMEYAKFEMLNTSEWEILSKKNVAYEIDLVFTKYPKNIEEWRTNYYQLLNDRLLTLFALDSSLQSPSIRWNMILQTQCITEEEAKKYFHGFVIKYRPRQAPVMDEVETAEQLKDLIAGRATTRDSTVFRVMERNPQWKNMLVVVDWTGSMYKFGAQLVLWYKQNIDRGEPKVRHFVFFNDGNSKKTWQKKTGRAGGVYRSKSGELEEIVATMEYVMKKGNGGDSPENDLEAILTGIQYLENFDEVILIADNKSAVRDIELLDKIHHPVRIIICDQKRGSPVHPDYIKIARQTGGSIHTLHKDIDYMKSLDKSTSGL